MGAAALAGLMLRLIFGFGYWTGKPLTHDEQEYLALASSLAAGRGLTYEEGRESGTAQQFGRAPGYPAFLAAIGATDAGYSSTPPRVKIAQSLAGALGVWVIGLLALGAAGPRAGVVAAWIAAFYPPLVSLSSLVLSETIASSIALASALALQRSDTPDVRGARLRWTGLAGVMVGIGALVRPSLILFMPVAALWLVVKRRFGAAAVLVAAALVLVAPWTVRNLVTYDRFVLIASEGGVTIWTGNHQLAIGEGDLAANEDLKRAELAFRAAHPGLSAEALEPLYYREALDYIQAHPGWWLRLLARKAFYLVVPVGPSYALHSNRYRAASIVPYLLVLPFAAAGVRRLAAGPRPPAALFLLAGSAVLACLIFFPQERFRIPVIDPTLIVCASGLAGRERL
jgi:4-amino-4-deoxy-L-arabinose transferase-like glycosyltransferase